MKNNNFIFLVLVLALFLNGCSTNKQYSKGTVLPSLANRYFDQKPPSLTAKIFAPDIISIKGRYEISISFSPDLDEMYFAASKKDQDPGIYFSKLKDKKWTPVKKANFTKGRKDSEMDPFVSPNGKRIYFRAQDSDYVDPKIWYVNRLENSWSNAIQLDSPINDDDVFYPNQAKNGDLFYYNIPRRKSYYAPNKNGKFPEAHELEIEFGIHAFISPSQDYLVVNAWSKENKQRQSDIYVCFKKQDGTWSKPVNLGSEVNSNFLEVVPSITPDGKYLFFSRFNEESTTSDLYWVSTEVIENLRPQE